MVEGESTLAESRGNTKICSVLFVDIVGYSKKTNADQIILKKQFVDFWIRATKDIPAKDVMVVDAGDGAALTSLVEPEDTLRVALKLHSLLTDEGAKLELPMQMRIGINFGPVQLSVDVHGKACIVGDAINIAQRVMSFAEGGQITISRSYYDAILPLSHKYAEMFQHLGKRSDKHGRQHEIYVFGSNQEALRGQAASPGPFKKHGEEVIGHHADSQAAAHAGSDKTAKPGVPVASKAAHLIASAFGMFLGFFKKIFAISVVLVVLYELMVLVPMIGYPGAIKAELGQQFESVKLFAVGEWKAAMAAANQPAQDGGGSVEPPVSHEEVKPKPRAVPASNNR
jgi:hypothetical protein